MSIILKYHLIDALLVLNEKALDGYQLSELADLPLENFYESIRGLFKQCCMNFAHFKNEQRVKTEGEIPQYIEEHIFDPNLSLATLSSRFQMTESNISVLAKQLLGEGFSSYVERIRIQKAKDLLVEGKMSIRNIAVSVGYLNANSFSRAFKRVMGISPSEFIRLNNV